MTITRSLPSAPPDPTIGPRAWKEPDIEHVHKAVPSQREEGGRASATVEAAGSAASTTADSGDRRCCGRGALCRLRLRPQEGREVWQLPGRPARDGRRG